MLRAGGCQRRPDQGVRPARRIPGMRLRLRAVQRCANAVVFRTKRAPLGSAGPEWRSAPRSEADRGCWQSTKRGCLPGAPGIPANDVKAATTQAVIPGTVAHHRREPGHARSAEVDKQRADPLRRLADHRQFAGGALLIVGLTTRLVGGALAGDMLVALLTEHIGDG